MVSSPLANTSSEALKPPRPHDVAQSHTHTHTGHVRNASGEELVDRRTKAWSLMIVEKKGPQTGPLYKIDDASNSLRIRGTEDGSLRTILCHNCRRKRAAHRIEFLNPKRIGNAAIIPRAAAFGRTWIEPTPCRTA